MSLAFVLVVTAVRAEVTCRGLEVILKPTQDSKGRRVSKCRSDFLPLAEPGA